MGIDNENTTYTNMYKNMSGKIILLIFYFKLKSLLFLAVLNNIEKINSLPTEIQTMSFDKIISGQQSNTQEIKFNGNERKGFSLKIPK